MVTAVGVVPPFADPDRSGARGAKTAEGGTRCGVGAEDGSPRLGVVRSGQEGLEPPTVGFGNRCSTNWSYCPIEAHNQTRTGDLFLTKEVLYLLSYVGALQPAPLSTTTDLTRTKRETRLELATLSLEG